MQQVFYSVTGAAAYLGVSRASFERLRKEQRDSAKGRDIETTVFEPMQTQFTFGPRYHIDQLKIIEGVMVENFTPEEGLELWEAKKSLIGKKSS